MKDIKEIFEKIQEHKREQREMNKSIRDALKNSLQYQDLNDEMERLRAKKAQIVDSIKIGMGEKMDLLKLNIKDHSQLLTDVALTTIMKGESIKLTDSENNEYEPIFSVRFQKTSNKSLENKDKN